MFKKGIRGKCIGCHFETFKYLFFTYGSERRSVCKKVGQVDAKI